MRGWAGSVQRESVGRERMWAEKECGQKRVQRQYREKAKMVVHCQNCPSTRQTVNQKDFKLTVIEAALKASRHSSTNAMQCRWCSFDDDHRCRKYVPALSCRSRSKSPNLSTTTKYNTQTKQQQKRQRFSTKSRRTRERGEIPTKDRRRTVPAALPKCCSTFPAPSSGGTRGPRFVVPCH